MRELQELSERRRLQRFPALELEVQIKVDRGIKARWCPVEAFDFTRSGLSITAPELLEVGAEVMVKIRLPLPTGDLTAERLVARVRNLHDSSAGVPRYGIEFDFTANRHMKALATAASLGRIEGILDRGEKLRNRMMTQEELMQSLQG